tara:strand:- start:19369 stop:19638 length:270 start_codon:yes stop_codon:yes gene_type:complete
MIMTEEMNEMNDAEKQLTEEQIEFNGLSPEMQVNVIITDMMATVDRLIEMRFVLNQILMANPHLGGMPVSQQGHTHIHDENCGEECQGE